MLFFIVKKFEPSSGANADRKGGRGGKDAAGRERRCLEGAGRRSASGRPVQVRELAMKMR